MKYRLLRKYKYQVIGGDVSVELHTAFCTYINTDWVEINGPWITVKNGYCWDGATAAIDTLEFMVPSLVHDALCQLIRLQYVPREKQILADEILKELCGRKWKFDGKKIHHMNKFRQEYVYKGVRWFGKFFTRVGKPQDEIHEIEEVKE